MTSRESEPENAEEEFGGSNPTATDPPDPPTRPTNRFAHIPSWASAHGALLLLLLVGLFTIVSTVKATDGLAPDSQYYVAMAYHYAGWSKEDAARIVQHQAEIRGWQLLDAETLFGWDLVKPRILYPLLSAPFVAVLGLRGMYVVPALSMMFLILATYYVSRRRMSAAAALVPLLLLCSSYYMFFFGSAMLTEALASALGAGILLSLPLDRRRSWKALAVCGLLTLMMAFTRQAAIIPAGGIFLAWIGEVLRQRSVRNAWLPFAAISSGVAVAAQIVQTAVWPSFSIFEYYMAKTESTTWSEAVLAMPQVIWRIVQTDISNYLSKDRGLLLLLVLFAVALIVRWRHVEAHLAFGAFATAGILNILNTTPTVFRYFMPMLALVMFAVGCLIQAVSDRADVLTLPQAGTD